MPLCLRQRGAQVIYLLAECRRDDRLRKKTNSSALLRTLFVEHRAHLAHECRPRANVFTIRQCWLTIRIVKIQYRRLREDVSCAGSARTPERFVRRKLAGPVVWMVRIAFYLRGPAFIAAHDDGCGGAKQRRSRRVEKHFAGNVLFRLVDVGDDFLRWLKNAATQTR